MLDVKYKVLNYTFVFENKTRDEVEQSLKTLFQLYRENIQGQLHIKPLVEGLTNQLFKITHENNSKEESFVIRIYGNDTNVIVDREREIYVLSIVDNDLLKAKFNNGIILRYEEGESLVSRQLLLHQEKIAKQIARLHKRPLFRSIRLSSPKNEFFECIESWITAAKGKNKNWSLQLTNGKIIDYKYIDSEFAFIKNTIYSALYHLVCSHNDINGENIILNFETGNVTFIDYEYAMNNVRGFDIANHFCEYAGVTTHFDFENNYPSKDVQLPFLQFYFEEYYGSKPSNEDIEALYKEVNQCAMMSHFLWGIWGIVQESISKLHFDFAGYSRSRFDQYEKGRSKYPDNLLYL